jgi:hypothetical protein
MSRSPMLTRALKRVLDDADSRLIRAKAGILDDVLDGIREALADDEVLDWVQSASALEPDHEEPASAEADPEPQPDDSPFEDPKPKASPRRGRKPKAEPAPEAPPAADAQPPAAAPPVAPSIDDLFPADAPADDAPAPAPDVDENPFG